MISKTSFNFSSVLFEYFPNSRDFSSVLVRAELFELLQFLSVIQK